MHVGRVADVAVVEADDVQSAGGELVAEVLVPGDHLRANPMISSAVGSEESPKVS